MTEKSYQYFELEVSLLGIKPKIWRRFYIKKLATFLDLHYAIQTACGWEERHLFAFQKNDPTKRSRRPRSTSLLSLLEERFGNEIEAEIAHKVKLSDVFDEATQKEMFYIYDFGDNWAHSVKLRGIHESTEKFKQRLISGARAFPLEDSGGLPGYQGCVEAFHNKKEAEEHMVEWIGRWNPETFDLEETKRQFDSPKMKAKAK